MSLLALSQDSQPVRLEARRLEDAPLSAAASDAGDVRDDVSVDTCETRRRIAALEEALERAASTPVLATEGNDSVEGLQLRLEHAGLATLRSNGSADGVRSGATSASPTPRSPRSGSARSGPSPTRTRRLAPEYRGASTGGNAAIDIVIATTLATQRAAIERRERAAAEKEAVIKNAARELQRSRADVALKQAQLENAVIEFQKREAELARGEAELVKQRRMLRHHRDNELRVRAAVSRARAVRGDDAYVDGADEREYVMHSDPDTPTDARRSRSTPRRGGTPVRQNTPVRAATPTSSARLGIVRSPAAPFESHDSTASSRGHASAGPGVSDAVAQAEEMMRATEAMIDRERAALRQEAEADRRRRRVAAEEAARRVEAAERQEAALAGIARDLRLVLDSSVAAASGTALAPELQLLQRRVESALGLSPPRGASPLAVSNRRSGSRSPPPFVFDDDL